MQPAPHAEPSPAPGVCQNCEAALNGPFCGTCGQRALQLDVSLGQLLREGTHEFTDLDRRVLGTMRLLLTRPGQLTSEMLAGRRQRYISPLRLYLVCSVAFFLLLVWLVPAPPPVSSAEVQRDRDLVTQPNDAGLKALTKRGAARAVQDPSTFLTRVLTTAPRTAFVLVPGFALLTMALFRRRVRFFVPHLYFALHFHSFVFVALAALVAIAQGGWPRLAVLAGLVLPAGYLILATRETFGARLGEALWKSTLVLFVYALAVQLALTAVMLLTMV